MDWISESIDQQIQEAGRRSRAQLAAIFAKQRDFASTELHVAGYKGAAKHVASGKKSPHQVYRQLKRVSRILDKRSAAGKDRVTLGKGYWSPAKKTHEYPNAKRHGTEGAKNARKTASLVRHGILSNRRGDPDYAKYRKLKRGF